MKIGPRPPLDAPPDHRKWYEQSDSDDGEPLHTICQCGGAGESNVPQHAKADDKRAGDLAQPIGEAVGRIAQRWQSLFSLLFGLNQLRHSFSPFDRSSPSL